MLNSDFLEKGLGIISLPYFVVDFSKKKCFSCSVLLTDQISFPDCFYFLRYWSVCALQLFANQVVTSNKAAFRHV